MQKLTHDAYLALCSGAEVLERDLHGDKVLRLTNGDFLKLFRRKRLISSTAWYPYAQRFADNASELRQRSIPCPEIVAVYRIPAIKRDAVLYHPLEGRTLREIISADEASSDLRSRLETFVSQLHESGIYFRSLHLGNILLTPTGTLGLIDIADMQISNRPLRAYQRRRNLQHLQRLPLDRQWLSLDSEVSTPDHTKSHEHG